MLMVVAIISFIAHQVRSDGNARDGLYHQRQTILRNANGPLYSLIYQARISWAWRNRAAQTWRRQFPLLTLGVVHIALFTASSILTSEVATAHTNGQVLLRGETPCQWWVSPSDDPDQTSFWTTQRGVFREARDYATTCYMSNSEPDRNHKCLRDICNTQHSIHSADKRVLPLFGPHVLPSESLGGDSVYNR